MFSELGQTSSIVTVFGLQKVRIFAVERLLIPLSLDSSKRRVRSQAKEKSFAERFGA